MPELPEVQTIVNDLKAAALIGNVITHASVHWPAVIATSKPNRFCRQIIGSIIVGIDRRAKLVLFQLDGGRLLAVHLRMTGRFQLVEGEHQRDKHVHVVLSLKDGRQIWYYDPRKFGRFYLLNNPHAFLAPFGPEPLTPLFTARKLGWILAGHRRRIKPLLLDQTVVAGLGNIYVDEALWVARVHPLRRSDTLEPAEVKRLHGAIRRVLRQAVRNAGTSLGRGRSNFRSLGSAAGRNAAHLKVFRRTGQPCMRCGDPIQRIHVGQRSTHLCVRCQPIQRCAE